MSAISATGLTDHAPVRRSERQWRALMRTYSRSGATRKQFCAHHGVALSTFDWWRARLRQESPTEVASRFSSAQVPALFVELETKPLSAASPVWDVELELGAGVYLRLRRATC